MQHFIIYMLKAGASTIILIPNIPEKKCILYELRYIDNYDLNILFLIRVPYTCKGFPSYNIDKTEAKCLKCCGMQLGLALLHTTKFQTFGFYTIDVKTGESP